MYGYEFITENVWDHLNKKYSTYKIPKPYNIIEPISERKKPIKKNLKISTKSKLGTLCQYLNDIIYTRTKDSLTYRLNFNIRENDSFFNFKLNEKEL